MSDVDPQGWDVLDRARDLVERGEEFALATVVWRQGPSSSHRGSRALVTRDGGIEGWVGGACAEPVVVREAQRVIQSREPRLICLGTDPERAGGIPEGAMFVPMSCQSEGAMHIFVEPVVPDPSLLVVGDSPMTDTLVRLAEVLGWSARRVVASEASTTDLPPGAVLVVATQGHGDEEAMEWAVAQKPAFLGLVASRRRGEAVLGYLTDRGVDREVLDRVRTPVGLDLGHTSHAEIAVAVLAELVQLRAAGELTSPAHETAPATATPGRRAAPAGAEVIDPVCGMTVVADAAHHPHEHAGQTYWFCCVGCHDRFVAEPETFLVSAEGKES